MSKDSFDYWEAYWEARRAELEFCLKNNLTHQDCVQENLSLKEEKSRLLSKLEKINNLSRYAWEQVEKNPEEAKELFKMINSCSDIKD